MRIISKAVMYLVLVCLLLSLAVGMQRPLRRHHGHNRSGRQYHRVFAHLRRCRGDNPTHHPVRPSKNAVLPPDDDSIDPERLHAKGIPQGWLAFMHATSQRSSSPTFGSRPPPTEVARHQTLCILLI